MMEPKRAYDDLIAAAYRAQADALEIEAQAKRRLADEYDAAQERGEVAKDGRPKTVPGGNGKATAADLGLSRKEIHDARVLRDAERQAPGIVARTVRSAANAAQNADTHKPAPLTPAQRMRAYRARKRAGENLVQALLDAGRLKEWDDGDKGAIGRAVSKLVADWAASVTRRNGADPLADAMVADSDNPTMERTGDHAEAEDADAADRGDTR